MDHSRIQISLPALRITWFSECQVPFVHHRASKVQQKLLTFRIIKGTSLLENVTILLSKKQQLFLHAGITL